MKHVWRILPVRIISLFFLAWSLAATSLITACTSQSAPAITVEDAWARPAKTGENSAVYFTLNNPTQQTDQMLTAESDVAEHVELHLSNMQDGKMMMHHQESIPILAGERTELKPGGLHVMLIRLTRDLNERDVFTLSLHFEDSDPIRVQVAVKTP